MKKYMKKKKVIPTKLKAGDTVMVVAGGNKKGEVLKGQTGKILSVSTEKGRATVQGLNMIKKHKKAMRSDDAAGIITKEGSIHLSNLMYYSEDIKRPVRLKSKIIDDGKKVRGFINPDNKEFQQLEN